MIVPAPIDDSKFFEAAQALAQGLSQWDLLILAGWLVIVVSTSYYRPKDRRVRAAYSFARDCPSLYRSLGDYIHRVVGFHKSMHRKFLMLRTGKLVPLMATVLLWHPCGCKPPATPQPVSSACDCSIFPPKSGCDAQCGITTGVVDSVSSNSVVILVPSVTTDSAGKSTPTISKKTFSIDATEAKQLESIAKGSRVALTFQQHGGQTIAKSIRENSSRACRISAKRKRKNN